jgi:cell division protease FtsH
MFALAASPGLANAAEAVDIPYSTLLAEVSSKQVEQLAFSSDEKSVMLKTVEGTAQTASVLPSVQAQLVELLIKNDVPFKASTPPSPNILALIAGTALQFAFPLFLLASFLSSRGGGAGGGMGGPGGMNPMQMGKSKSTLEMEPNTGVTFKDVAGCDGSKLELTEVVEFLTDPAKYDKVGARAPRGVLMEGPPGTGKTLLARAVAGEAGVPFISASGSEFVEMFVGVGASRVRDIFEKAKKNAPCIIFIDEIDAVAKKRAGGAGGASGGGGGNSEAEQTLNQLLTEMDGFGGVSGVVVIAATNRADVLDPAVLRPGRFDRRVPVDLPDRTGRESILKVHARNKPLDASVDLAVVAARTTGFSGASLMNLLNEAAIVTARRSKDEISMLEVEYALDRLTVGMEKRTGMNNAKRQELVAYHEAGHALAAALTPGFDEVGKVTIIPRTNGAGGFTLFLPSDEQQDSGMYTRSYLESRLVVALGGRIAEELRYGMDEITTGASGDFQQVASLARNMVTQWGFASDTLGATAWESSQGSGFGSPQMASEATQERIDAEVSKIVDKAYTTCRTLLEDNRALLDDLTTLLMKEETIDNVALLDLVRKAGVLPKGKGAKFEEIKAMMGKTEAVAA